MRMNQISRRVRAIGGVLAIALTICALTASAEDSESHKIEPWRRPPVNMRASYTLDHNRVLLAYSFERVASEGIIDGTSSRSSLSVINSGFASSPTSVDRDRHTFYAMWSPFDDLTFRFELPFEHVVVEQDYLTAAGPMASYKTESDGFGDIQAWVLYRVAHTDRTNVHLNVGLSLPSGSINETQVTAQSAGQLIRLPYPLQMGSGTVDLMPGVTYRGRWERLEWGGQALGTLRAGTNSQGYTLGNLVEVTSYGAWKWVDWMSTSFTLQWRQEFNGSGADPLINPTSSPIAQLGTHASQRLDALFGLALTPTGGFLRNTRWVVNAGLPAYQWTEAPLPRVSWRVVSALEYAF